MTYLILIYCIVAYVFAIGFLIGAKKFTFIRIMITVEAPVMLPIVAILFAGFALGHTLESEPK